MATVLVALITFFILRWVWGTIRSFIEAGREIRAALDELEAIRRLDAALMERHVEILLAEVEAYVRRAADDRT